MISPPPIAAASPFWHLIPTTHRYLPIPILIGHGWCMALTFGDGLRPLFRPLRPDLRSFPFRCGWRGAERYSAKYDLSSHPARPRSLGRGWSPSGVGQGDAIERLTELLLRLPGGGRPPAEARQIAIDLIDVLPPRKGTSRLADATDLGPLKIKGKKAFWVSCFVLTAVAFMIMFANG